MSEVKSVKYIVSGSGNITLWITREDGTNKSYSVATDHEKHRKIVEKLKAKDWKNLEEMIDVERKMEVAKERVEKDLSKVNVPVSLVGTAEIKNGQIYVNNVPVHNVVSDRILQLAADDYPFDSVLRFLENVLMNPSSRSQEELYDFLANRNLPLTEDGCFLAYKRIRNDWKDIYSGKIDNSVGSIVEVPREEVDSDRARECSHGLHVGALEYIRTYGTAEHSSRVVVVKVNPKDCVSVPRDHRHMKLRVCRYEILYELETGDKEALGLPVYSSNGDRFANPNDWMDSLDDEDYEDEDYWEDGWDEEGVDPYQRQLENYDEDCEDCEEDCGWCEPPLEDLKAKERKQALDDLVRLTEEYGGYDKEFDRVDDIFLKSFDPNHDKNLLSEEERERLDSVRKKVKKIHDEKLSENKLPEPNHVWVFDKPFPSRLTECNKNLGTRVIIRRVDEYYVVYTPGLNDNSLTGSVEYHDFLNHFSFVI